MLNASRFSDSFGFQLPFSILHGVSYSDDLTLSLNAAISPLLDLFTTTAATPGKSHRYTLAVVPLAPPLVEEIVSSSNASRSLDFPPPQLCDRPISCTSVIVPLAPTFSLSMLNAPRHNSLCISSSSFLLGFFRFGVELSDSPSPGTLV